MLTEAQESQIDAALVPRPEQQVLVDAFRLQITRKDMYTLKGLNWLNDEVCATQLTIFKYLFPDIYLHK